MAKGNIINKFDKEYEEKIKKIDDNMKFLNSVNYGGEFMLGEVRARYSNH